MRTSTGRSAVNVLGTLTSGLLLGLGVVACGTDRAATEAVSDTGPTATNRSAGAPSPDAGDPGRYCALTRQLEASGRTVFADLGHDATPAEYADAERTFVRANEDRLTARRHAPRGSARRDGGLRHRHAAARRPGRPRDRHTTGGVGGGAGRARLRARALLSPSSA